MAMPLPVSIPSTASPSASDDSSNTPRTPISPSLHTFPLPEGATANLLAPQQLAQNLAHTQTKRKPSRRANTAERRATHNAVERQRRETLNGRFLDLAALLPNLSQIRRPSKSSIVNSSIAHVHAFRRHRALAARELRNLKAEYDTIRREVNEWRDRSGIPRVEEPLRGDSFAMILSGELEIHTSIPEDEEEMAHSFDGLDEHEDDYAPATCTRPIDDFNDPRIPNFPMLKNASTFGHSLTTAALDTGVPQPVMQLRRQSAPQQRVPVIVPNPPAVSIENPAVASFFEPQVHAYGAGQFLPQHAVDDKVAAWDAQVYSQHQQAVRPQFTPDRATTQHTTAAFVDQAMFASIHRQPSQLVGLPLHSTPYYGSDSDDTSSVGSERDHSGSISGGSGYGSPLHHESPMNYEFPGIQADFSVPRKMSTTGHGLGPGVWTGEPQGMVGMGLMKQGLGSPISVGGTGFGMLM